MGRTTLSALPDEVTKRMLELAQKYRGLRAEELDAMNPEYSCVICAKIKCNSHNHPKSSCPDHEIASEEDFAQFYSFK